MADIRSKAAVYRQMTYDRNNKNRIFTSFILHLADMKRLQLFVLALSIFVSGCSPEASSQTAVSGNFTPVALPALPKTMDFAGEPVPLEYFDVREALQRELLVTCYMHSRTWQTLLNAERYFPVIEPILKRYGIPDDFKYLCMAESGLNPETVSPAGAAGLWQFMPATGKEYGLRVEQQIDERYAIEKSTEAACQYLRDAYERFGSWTLAAAAYNAGNAGVERRMSIQGTDNYYDTFLPQETMRYVYRILSLKAVSTHPESYGFTAMKHGGYGPLDNYRTVEVAGENIEWSEVAASYGTNYKMLRLLNPWIRDYVYDNPLGITLTIKVPGEGFRTAK